MKHETKRDLRRGILVALGVLAAGLTLAVGPAEAGKLRSSLIDVSDSLRAVDRQVDAVADDFEKISSNAWQLMQMTAGGIDETYLYINEKLKARGEKYEDHLKEPIAAFADNTVKAFVKGIRDGARQAVRFSKEWQDTGDGLRAELARLDGALDDVERMIAKKKKKWFQSKKYKKKLKTYEDALEELRQKSRTIGRALNEAQQNNPPSPRQIQRTLAIGPKSTLKELDDLASIEVQNLLKKYGDAKKTAEGSGRKFRQAGDFAGELKILRAWVAEADEMEK